MAVFVKQVGQLAVNCAAKLVNVGNGDGTPVITGHIMPNPDGSNSTGDRFRYRL